MPWWQVAVGAAALLAAAVAVWVTLEADFLAQPGWLAVQKADFILGPVFVGLYWLRQRPESRFGPLLLVFGAVGAVYILQSASNPWLFGAGLHWENVIYVTNLLLILTFPTGRLEGVFAKLIILSAVGIALLYAVIISLLPVRGAGGSISGCREACPENGLAITSNVPLAVQLSDIGRVAIIVVALATAGLLIWRIVTGTPPQRRAVAIGTSVALVFTAVQIMLQVLNLVGTDATGLLEVLQWTQAVARSVIWYGFLFALIAAQLFAGRALHRLVRQSLRRPSLPELETMLRAPLGDPDLRLTFLDRTSETAADQLLEPGPGREITIVEYEDGAPGAAIDHDAQLADDPELLRAAGVVALLAAENAELDTAWHDALRDLRQSRARIVVAGDAERRKIERNLHDGVQQRLVAIRIQLGLAGESAEGPGPIGDRLHDDRRERRASDGRVARGRPRALSTCTQQPRSRRRARARATPPRGTCDDSHDRAHPLSRRGGIRRLLLLSGGDPERHEARRAGRGDHGHVARRRRRAALRGRRRRDWVRPRTRT